MDITNVISLLGGVSLFLFGMTLMGDNLKKVAGSRLELVLYRLSGTPLRGILLGTGVTAVIQSSSATSVMVVGFVNSGMMKLRQAISVIMGSLIGTSVTGWIICLSDVGSGATGWLKLLSTDVLSSLVALWGILLTMFSKKTSRRSVGGILLGFAVLMFGMKTMSGAVSPLRDAPGFVRLLTAFSRPVPGILAGALFTCVLQSASAAVGIVQALSVTGAITFSAALPLIMGIAVGASFPVLLSAIGANADARRSAWSYLLVNSVGVLLFGTVFYAVHAAVSFPFMGEIMDTFSIALLNSVFRAVIVVCISPFLALLEKLMRALIPDREGSEAALADMDRLEERFLTHAPLAIEQSRLTIDSMAEHARENLKTSLALLDSYTEEGFAAANRQESAIDRYEDKLGAYLVKITAMELDENQNRTVGMYLRTITDLERISDHALNVAESAREISEKAISFSTEGQRELDVLRSAVAEVLELAIGCFLDSDPALAQRVEPLEERIDQLCREMKTHHILRVRRGECTLEHGFVFNDMLVDFERIGDHCSNIALAVIDFLTDAPDAHAYTAALRAEHTAVFDRTLEEYTQKYAI